MKQKGIFYTILSAVSFGIMPLLCSQAYDLGANAETLVFLRNVFAIMILFVLMKQKHISFAISRKDFKNTALVGIFGITLTALLLYNAYSYISLGTATTLHFLYPAFVALINYVFYKEHLAKSTVLVLLAATLGIFFFFEPGNGNSSIGILLAIASSISYAFYMTGVERRRLNQLNSYKLTFYLALIACFVMFFYNLVLNKMVWQLPLAAYGYAFLIGFGCSFFAVFTLQLGIKYLGASTAAIFCMFEPVTAVLAEWVLLGETLSVSKTMGCLLILGAVSVLILLDKKQSSASREELIEQFAD